ncbi:MAG: heparinase II/III family protein [Candidatus Latescibacteria bacterium]|jgi:hypothetical protein|nr:heparinase II/III family protein [Candidatus Latescibacterota bacterium]
MVLLICFCIAVLLLLWGTALAGTLPGIPEGISPESYYDGFYPTQAWVGELRPIPLDRRDHPFQQVEIVRGPSGDPKQNWDGAVIRRTSEDIEKLRRDVQPFLDLPPEAYSGLVPRRNRISGNDRVMIHRHTIPCPTGDGGRLMWRPDRPDAIRCSRGHLVDPFEMFPPTGTIRITGPQGEEQAYPYHDTPDGEKRIYLIGEFMDPLRLQTLSDAVQGMGILYAVTGEEAYAHRVAAILCDFAEAVPHWPKVARGIHSGLEGADRFLPTDDYRDYSGIWYDKYHSGIGSIPASLASGYDFVVKAPMWAALDARAEGGDARAAIEDDLFLYSARDEIMYDVHYPRPSSAVSNYIPYQMTGLASIGRAVGIPELVHYMHWKGLQLVRKTLMADGMFPESVSYARQHVYGIARATVIAEGYTDPPGFVSSIDGKRFKDLDILRDLPELGRAIRVLETLTYPDGESMMIHDTYGRLVSAGFPPPSETKPMIYPAFGHGVLGRGDVQDRNQVQAHLHYSGNWGHDHADMLNFVLWSCNHELISDIGYAHTYRLFASNTSGHNTVVVDRSPQGRDLARPGDLIAWHPVSGGVQVIEVSGESAYSQCETYRRTLMLLPVDQDDALVLDIFDVEGGDVHEWMAQGSCMVDGTLEVSVPTEFHGESYAHDKEPFEPPRDAVYRKARRDRGIHPHRLEPGEPDPWYGVFRNVYEGEMAGSMTARFGYDTPEVAALRLHVLSPDRAQVYTCTVPSLRKVWSKAAGREEHEQVEQFRMPKLILRREGSDLHSRFVVLWEPTRNGVATHRVRSLAEPEADGVAVEIETDGPEPARTMRLYCGDSPSSMVTGGGITFRGRYAAFIQEDGKRTVSLYDATRFEGGGLDIAVTRRAPLPIAEVVRLEEDRWGVVLDGCWDDVTAESPRLFDQAEQVIVDQDGTRRAFPVSEVTAGNGKALLVCERDPGFDYDALAHVLRDRFSPFNTVDGEALVELPSRVRVVQKDGQTTVVATDSVTVNGTMVEPTQTGTSF